MIKRRINGAVAGVVALGLSFGAMQVKGFSLLGPYAPWMDRSIGYHLPGDIGGPMNIGEGYRWNVPVLTYAFDQSFLDYFGSNGVAQVEAAIQVLNDLPPASQVVLSNFPTQMSRENYRGYINGLTDVQATTLALLLEHLGLAKPIRNMYSLTQLDPSLLTPWQSIGEYWPLPDSVSLRNYDPEALLPSIYINGTPYFGAASTWANPFGTTTEWVTAYLGNGWYGADNPWIPVADTVPYRYGFGAGYFFLGLTQDDAGGLRYLFSTNTVSLEALPPDVHAAGTNPNNYVDLAFRPGIEKLTFVRHSYDAALGQVIPFTNQFLDTYISNGVPFHQQLERVVPQPDFLFSTAVSGPLSGSGAVCDRSGTSNWWNSALLTGTTNSGPGVIRPPVRITFNNPGVLVDTSGANPTNASVAPCGWGSYDNSTNPPVAYPVPTFSGNYPLTVQFSMYPSGYTPQPAASFNWQVPLAFGAAANLQVSSNLVDWVTVTTVTNRGATVSWRHTGAGAPRQFFRVAP
jgi:hypothetical protein